MNNNLLIIFAIIALLAGSGYMYYDKTHAHKHEVPQPHQQAPVQPPVEAPSVPQDAPLPKIEPLNKIDPKPASYQEAVALSKKNGKKMVLYFGATWCGPCREMSPIFSSPEVENALKDFVFYKMDVDQNREISRKYKVTGIPAYCIADSNETVIKQDSGKKTASQFVNWLKN